MRLRIVPVGRDAVGLWRDLHNAVIPAHHLTDGETATYVDLYLAA